MTKLLIPLVLVVSLATAHAKPRKQSIAYALSGVGTGASVVLTSSAFFLPKENHDLNYPLLFTGVGM